MERRKFQRFEVELPLSFSGNEVAGGGLVTNISQEGCWVVSDEPLRSHTFLALRVQLLEQYAPLQVEVGEVRWVSAWGFGVQFIHLRAEEQERLSRFISLLTRSQNN